jgi:four helix bundle protein
MQDFKKLLVWKKAHELTLGLYGLTATFPRDETYGLTSQIRRAVSSIPANIAEGCGREGNVELTRFLFIAMGSASELEYHLLLARDLKYFPVNDHDQQPPK